MSNIKPILFNTDMVQAILEGRKRVTRRAIKKYIEMCDIDVDGTIIGLPDMYGDFHRIEEFAPYEKGDILYVRETWWEDRFYRFRGKENPQYYYRADGETITIGREVFLAPKWKPSIHMPKEAARIFLRVTNVSVAKLQNSFIADETSVFGFEAEGITLPEVCKECISSYGFPYCNDDEEGGLEECGNLDDVRYEFSELWDSTIKPKDKEKYGWSANPWVWVIEFEREEHKNEQ